ASPTSKLKPHPVRSSSKWRVSFSDSGPLRRRLTSMRAGNGFARVYRGGATAGIAVASIISNSCSGDSTASQILPVISDCERRANIHSALRSGGFLGCFRLLKKMNGSLIAVVGDEIRRFFETETTQRTASIYVPLSRCVLRLFAQFVCHALK